MISYFLSIKQKTILDKLFYLFFAYIMVLFSFHLSHFSHGLLSQVQLLSITSGVIIAATYLYGRTGIIGIFLGLLTYYTFIKASHNGVGYLYSLVITSLLIISLSLIEKLRNHHYITRLIFSFYVFITPGFCSLALAIFTPHSFNTAQALNLFLTDSIGILLTAPVIGLFLIALNKHKEPRSLLREFSHISKSNFIYKSLIVLAIFFVLLNKENITYSYMTYLFLLPLVIMAAFNFSELTQILLIVIGYSLLIKNDVTADLLLLNTKLTIFFMFSLIVYIMLDFKVSLRKETERFTKNLYFDNQSNFGTFQKLDDDTLHRRDFVVAAIDLSPIFKYPLIKRDKILRQIASYINKSTNFYDQSYVLYDVAALVILLENNLRAIGRLDKLSEMLNASLEADHVNFHIDKIFFCRCKKGNRIKQTINQIHMNLRLAERNNSHTMVDCDHSRYTNYITLLDNFNPSHIQILRQNYQGLAHDRTSCFELLSRFTVKGKPLNTETMFFCAQKLGHMEMLEKAIVRKMFEYIQQLPIDSFDYGAINLSPDFLSSDLSIDTLLHIAHELNVPLDKICIEIVESGSINDFDALMKNLLRLKHAGFKIALDDFGAGHSTYKQLLNMPIDTVKIDGSLIKDCHNDPIKQTIIENLRAITTLSKIKLVAECVETEEEQQWLQQIGVDYLQGYLIHRPSLSS
ncbi:hypothetical protein ABT56_07335 [Photobacterium aquae]|uniref:EAL domain-containing protein n=1 Tax=Photobacterium aquae TaxID=1195763 RepID=A0A0J1H5G0_9GAMM|nr:EAL domain-containing protein [Photobacterium aquae]KLV06958.1 hypothetical protein ABT56_07335 [Photobacterium aquae]